jgi:hypothetical protein
VVFCWMTKYIEAPDTAIFALELEDLSGVKAGMRERGLTFRILERRAKTVTLEVVGLKAGKAIRALSPTARREDRM